MNRPGLLAIALIAALAAPAAAQEWVGRGRLQGIIKDEAGKGLAGARVTLLLGDSGPEPITTNAKGRWTVLGLAHGDWVVRVDAPGYVGTEGSVKVFESGPGASLEIALRKPTAEEVTAADPETAKRSGAVAMLKQGNAFVEQQQYAAARAEYEKALADLPPENHPPILRAIGSSWYAEGDVEQAVAAFRRGLELAPDDAELLRTLANVLVASGREAEAEPYLARLPADAKMDPNALLNVGIAAYNEGDMTKALSYFERVVAENVEYPDGYYYRGLVYLNQGDNAKALADLEKFLAMAPEHAKASDARDILAYLK